MADVILMNITMAFFFPSIIDINWILCPKIIPSGIKPVYLKNNNNKNPSKKHTEVQSQEQMFCKTKLIQKNPNPNLLTGLISCLILNDHVMKSSFSAFSTAGILYDISFLFSWDKASKFAFNSMGRAWWWWLYGILWALLA